MTRGRWGIVIGMMSFGLFLSASTAAQAQSFTSVNVRIETPTDTLYDDVRYISSDGCTVEDSNGIPHTVAGSSALCALQSAATHARLTLSLNYFDGFGLFVDGIGSATSDMNNYWMYFVDYQSPAVGIADSMITTDGTELLLSFGADMGPVRLEMNQQQVVAGDLVSASVTTGEYSYNATTGLCEWKESPAAGAQVKITSTGITQTVLAQGDGVAQFVLPQGQYVVQADVEGFTRSPWQTVSVYPRRQQAVSFTKKTRRTLSNKGVDYIKGQIDGNGLIDGSVGMTEWAVMALSSAGKKSKALTNQVRAYDPTPESGTFELARHILALEAIGKDGNYFRGINYLDRMKETRDNYQYGSQELCNDDIFAGLAMLAADEPYSTEALNQAIAQSLLCVQTDGGVSYAVGGASDVDTTAAWLMFVGRLKNHESEHGFDLEGVRQNALSYLTNAQNYDGGWGYAPNASSNSSSTAWVLTAFRAQGSNASAVKKNFLNGFHFLRTVASASGAMTYDTLGTGSSESLNTVYAIMALNGQPLPVNMSAKAKATKKKWKNKSKKKSVKRKITKKVSKKKKSKKKK